MVAKKTLISAILFVSISFFGHACSSPPQDESSQTNLSNIQMLLAGDYIGMGRQGEIYHSIVKLQVPQFGGNIFYHHISNESLRGLSAYRKIYVFDETGKLMRSTVILGRGEMFVDEQSMARKLNELTEVSLLRFPDGCQFQWRIAADGFVAEVRRDRCRYDSPAFGGIVSPEMEYKLSDCGLVINEGIFREDDSPVFPSSMINNRRINSKQEAHKAPVCNIHAWP